MVLEVPNSQTWPFGPSSGFVVVNDGIVNLLATIFKIIYLFKAIILQLKIKKKRKKTPASTAGGTDSISSWRTKISHAQVVQRGRGMWGCRDPKSLPC